MLEGTLLFLRTVQKKGEWGGGGCTLYYTVSWEANNVITRERDRMASIYWGAGGGVTGLVALYVYYKCYCKMDSAAVADISVEGSESGLAEAAAARAVTAATTAAAAGTAAAAVAASAAAATAASARRSQADTATSIEAERAAAVAAAVAAERAAAVAAARIEAKRAAAVRHAHPLTRLVGVPPSYNGGLSVCDSCGLVGIPAGHYCRRECGDRFGMCDGCFAVAYGSAPPARAWVTRADPASGRTYYANADTGETTWERPADFADFAPPAPCAPPSGAWGTHMDPTSGHPYYQNRVTGETQWDKPPGMAIRSPPPRAAPPPMRRSNWDTIMDPDSGYPYYQNRVTGETTWDQPPELAASSHRPSSFHH